MILNLDASEALGRNSVPGGLMRAFTVPPELTAVSRICPRPIAETKTERLRPGLNPRCSSFDLSRKHCSMRKLLPTRKKRDFGDVRTRFVMSNVILLAGLSDWKRKEPQ